jgi:hypothetical protein
MSRSISNETIHAVCKYMNTKDVFSLIKSGNRLLLHQLSLAKLQFNLHFNVEFKSGNLSKFNIFSIKSDYNLSGYIPTSLRKLSLPHRDFEKSNISLMNHVVKTAHINGYRDYTRLVSLYDFTSLPNLESLEVRSLSDYSIIKDCTNLKSLKIYAYGFIFPEPVKLPLEELILGEAPSYYMTNVDINLDYLPLSLTRLVLLTRKYSDADIQILDGFPNLKSIVVVDHDVTDISPLSRLTDLQICLSPPLIDNLPLLPLTTLYLGYSESNNRRNLPSVLNLCKGLRVLKICTNVFIDFSNMKLDNLEVLEVTTPNKININLKNFPNLQQFQTFTNL